MTEQIDAFHWNVTVVPRALQPRSETTWCAGAVRVLTRHPAAPACVPPAAAACLPLCGVELLVCASHPDPGRPSAEHCSQQLMVAATGLGQGLCAGCTKTSPTRSCFRWTSTASCWAWACAGQTRCTRLAWPCSRLVRPLAVLPCLFPVPTHARRPCTHGAARLARLVSQGTGCVTCHSMAAPSFQLHPAPPPGQQGS